MLEDANSRRPPDAHRPLSSLAAGRGGRHSRRIGMARCSGRLCGKRGGSPQKSGSSRDSHPQLRHRLAPVPVRLAPRADSAHYDAHPQRRSRFWASGDWIRPHRKRAFQGRTGLSPQDIGMSTRCACAMSSRYRLGVISQAKSVSRRSMVWTRSGSRSAWLSSSDGSARRL